MSGPRRTGLRAIALALAVLAGGAAAAAAHDQPYSFLDVRLEGSSLRGRVMVHVVDLARVASLAAPESLLSSSFVAAQAPLLRSTLSARMPIEADGSRIAPELGEPEIVRDRALVAFDWHASVPLPPRRIVVRGRIITDDVAHESFVNLYDGPALKVQAVLDAESQTAELDTGRSPGLGRGTLTFVLQGIHHIAIGPDHILFIVGLVLAGGGALRLLKIATAFTIAHSLTLALATLGVANPPPRLIEPLIALSIVWVGIENLRRRSHDLRVPLAFGFGLVHGFGFAGVLREFGLPPGALAASLVSFNLGVEIAQAAIVLTLAPALGWLQHRSPAGSQGVLRAGSAVVILAGGFWLIQRVLA